LFSFKLKIETNENTNKEMNFTNEIINIHNYEEKDICFFCRRKKEAFELAKAGSIEEKNTSSSTRISSRIYFMLDFYFFPSNV